MEADVIPSTAMAAALVASGCSRMASYRNILFMASRLAFIARS